MTALVVPSVFAPAFHPMTTELDARPLLVESLFLAGVTLASALIEAGVWVGSVKSGAAVLGKTALLSLAVLGALFPIGLALFLLPERPTRLMEAQVAANRRLALSDLVRKVSVPQWPRAQTTGQFVTALGGVSATDSSLLSYVPEYRRFDTREMRRQPVEFNRDLDGTPVRFEGNVRWVFRFRDSDGKSREVTEDGRFRRSGPTSGE